MEHRPDTALIECMCNCPINQDGHQLLKVGDSESGEHVEV